MRKLVAAVLKRVGVEMASNRDNSKRWSASDLATDLAAVLVDMIAERDKDMDTKSGFPAIYVVYGPPLNGSRAVYMCSMDYGMALDEQERLAAVGISGIVVAEYWPADGVIANVHTDARAG